MCKWMSIANQENVPNQSSRCANLSDVCCPTRGGTRSTSTHALADVCAQLSRRICAQPSRCPCSTKRMCMGSQADVHGQPSGYSWLIKWLQLCVVNQADGQSNRCAWSIQWTLSSSEKGQFRPSACCLI